MVTAAKSARGAGGAGAAEACAPGKVRVPRLDLARVRAADGPPAARRAAPPRVGAEALTAREAAAAQAQAPAQAQVLVQSARSSWPRRAPHRPARGPRPGWVLSARVQRAGAEVASAAASSRGERPAAPAQAQSVAAESAGSADESAPAAPRPASIAASTTRLHARPVRRLRLLEPGLFLSCSDDGTAAFLRLSSDADGGAGLGPVRLQGHSGAVLDACSLRLGPASTAALATASEDRTLRVWAHSGGPALQVLSGHRAAVTRVAACAEMRRLVSGARDGTVRVWCGDSWICLGELRDAAAGLGPVLLVHALPLGRVLAVAADDCLALWPAPLQESAPALARRPGAGFCCASLAPDCSDCCVGTRSGEVLVVSLAGVAPVVVHVLELAALGVALGAVTALSRCDDASGRHVLAAGLASGSLILWDVSARTAIALVLGAHGGWVLDLCVVPLHVSRPRVSGPATGLAGPLLIASCASDGSLRLALAGAGSSSAAVSSSDPAPLAFHAQAHAGAALCVAVESPAGFACAVSGGSDGAVCRCVVSLASL
jgi:WD40 repeat protein